MLPNLELGKYNPSSSPSPPFEEKHISDVPANSCRQHAFHLLRKYADKNSDKQFVEKFKISQASVEEYRKWAQQKQKGTSNQFIAAASIA